jgi:formylglycine-generating enzyme required for sulfatase activity
MGCWFLSYNSQDLALMQGLEAALRRKDPKAQIFFAPTSLRAGGFWLPELAKGITAATAFVLLVGEKGLGPWQVMEYYEALDRRVKQHDFPVVLVLLDGVPAPGLPFLRQLHWIISADPASEQSVAQIMDAAIGGGGLPGELWRHTAPYRGLAAMTEADSDFFFGRGRETVEVIRALEATPDKLPVLLGNSGVGKSSLAQAGVLAAFVRQAWPETAAAPGAWPQAFNESRTWCVLTLKPGTEPVRALVEPFIRIWQFDSTDPRRETRQREWTDSLIQGQGTLRGLLDATEQRLQEQGRSKAPAFLLYVDQGEELYVRAEPRQRQRFSQILAEGLADPRLRALMSLRADFFGELLNDAALQDISRKIEVPPLREAELREIVSRPAQLLSARFETDGMIDTISRRAAEDSVKDVGALPLLSYTLDDMWTNMVRRGDGTLRLPAQSFELGGVLGVLVDRADTFLAAHPGAEAALKRVFTLRCANVREDGEPTRRRGARGEFSNEEWRLVSELADYPNRLLVIVTTESGETFAEVAHEAIFRRWDKLHEWITSEREFLAWRSGLEAARRAWQAEDKKEYALLMGVALAKAQNWKARRGDDLVAADRDFIDRSVDREMKARRRSRRAQTLVYALMASVIIGLVGWVNQSYIRGEWRWYAVERPFVSPNIWPYVLTAAAEQVLKPKDTFRECTPGQGKDYCPEMVVVPAGSFIMGSPPTEKGRTANEGPQHQVIIGRPFAVSKFELTFDEWDTCVAYGDCAQGVSDDLGWGRGQRPAINVSWEDAQRYVQWLSKVTGKPYRLLTGAEFEYAARAGTQTAYPWGDDIGKNNANCAGCGSQWDGRQTGPVGSFAANGFGLYDMVGNVWQMVQDCYYDNLDGAPTDGSAWTEQANCRVRVVRGGSWDYPPERIRVAHPEWLTVGGYRNHRIGFRVARTLVAP